MPSAKTYIPWSRYRLVLTHALELVCLVLRHAYIPWSRYGHMPWRYGLVLRHTYVPWCDLVLHIPLGECPGRLPCLKPLGSADLAELYVPLCDPLCCSSK